VSVRDLCDSIDETRNIQRLDLMWPNDPLVSSLAVATSMRAELVGQALPASLQGLYGKGINECWPYNRALPWHLRTGSPSPNVGGQYCIDCLRESRCYQLRWRISVYGCCLLHKNFLRECCPHCDEPIRDASQFFNWRVPDPDREIELCGYCGGSLVRCEPSEFVTNDALELAQIYDSLVRNPNCLGYFSVLYKLLQFMCGVSNLAKLMRSEILADSRQLILRCKDADMICFEVLDAKSRLTMLTTVLHLFKDWPVHFVDAVRSHSIRNWWISGPNLPRWYLNAVELASTKRWNLMSCARQEFLSAATLEGWASVGQFADRQD